MAGGSPNFGARRNGARPELVVIHYTAMSSVGAARDRLCDPAAEVSAHWLIGADGVTEPLVDEGLRAWHAGAGSWAGQPDVNSRSIGIELDNRGHEPFPEPQMHSLEVLLAQILDRWSIPPEGVIGHSDMAPDRKYDPGPKFDWCRLARQGLSIWPEPLVAIPADQARFRHLLTMIGYPDCADIPRLAAFRMRFRPCHAGPLDARDMALACDLAARFGQDGAQWRAD
ncbi:N-acetylmuramoyl-L-alanine amidase [Rhodobacteraceae bacterium]|nr:N-acetylmuramoyl-L-alanine amidase [Paracoccaceae bacterium]